MRYRRSGPDHVLSITWSGGFILVSAPTFRAAVHEFAKHAYRRFRETHIL